MKTVESKLRVELLVDCPHCDTLIDLLNESDTDGVAHNDCGDIIKEAVPCGNWDESHRKFELDEVTCTECKGVFNVRGIEW